MTKLQAFMALAVGGLIGYVAYDQMHPPPRAPSIDRQPASAMLEFEPQKESGYMTKILLGVEVAPLVLERLYCTPDNDPLKPNIWVVRSSCWMTSGSCRTGTVIISGELLGGGRELDFTIDHKDDNISLICVEKNMVREVSRHNGG